MYTLPFIYTIFSAFHDLEIILQENAETSLTILTLTSQISIDLYIIFKKKFKKYIHTCR